MNTTGMNTTWGVFKAYICGFFLIYFHDHCKQPVQWLKTDKYTKGEGGLSANLPDPPLPMTLNEYNS